uniref:Uncharacterized protein n=1 Tax=Salix viminalis TaxID=40686 RepID=A0A6N2MTX0_SALVM
MLSLLNIGLNCRTQQASRGIRAEIKNWKSLSRSHYQTWTRFPSLPSLSFSLKPYFCEGEWAITSVLHDATAVAGSGIGGLLSAVHGSIPYTL